MSDNKVIVFIEYVEGQLNIKHEGLNQLELIGILDVAKSIVKSQTNGGEE